MDTACDQDGFFATQRTWIENLVRDHLCDRRLVRLFPRSTVSRTLPSPTRWPATSSAACEDQKAFLWYWGHEHLLALYDRHAGWAMTGRCAGHSGFPYAEADVGDRPADHLDGSDAPAYRGRPVEGRCSGRPGATLPNPYILRYAGDFGPNGYMALHLTGPTLIEELRDPAGLVLATQEFSARQRTRSGGAPMAARVVRALGEPEAWTDHIAVSRALVGANRAGPPPAAQAALALLKSGENLKPSVQ